ncbi:unnamed protein product [Amoebophrya sp. A25]|nr:unnamed protein product [Amoebophrya sp. A25]|eukprot:GSA25T00000761001.1
MRRLRRRDIGGPACSVNTTVYFICAVLYQFCWSSSSVLAEEQPLIKLENFLLRDDLEASDAEDDKNGSSGRSIARKNNVLPATTKKKGELTFKLHQGPQHHDKENQVLSSGKDDPSSSPEDASPSASLSKDEGITRTQTTELSNRSQTTLKSVRAKRAVAVARKRKSLEDARTKAWSSSTKKSRISSSSRTSSRRRGDLDYIKVSESITTSSDEKSGKRSSAGQVSQDNNDRNIKQSRSHDVEDDEVREGEAKEELQGNSIESETEIAELKERIRKVRLQLGRSQREQMQLANRKKSLANYEKMNSGRRFQGTTRKKTLSSSRGLGTVAADNQGTRREVVDQKLLREARRKKLAERTQASLKAQEDDSGERVEVDGSKIVEEESGDRDVEQGGESPSNNQDAADSVAHVEDATRVEGEAQKTSQKSMRFTTTVENKNEVEQEEDSNGENGDEQSSDVEAESEEDADSKLNVKQSVTRSRNKRAQQLIGARAEATSDATNQKAQVTATSTVRGTSIVPPTCRMIEQNSFVEDQSTCDSACEERNYVGCDKVAYYTRDDNWPATEKCRCVKNNASCTAADANDPDDAANFDTICEGPRYFHALPLKTPVFDISNFAEKNAVLIISCSGGATVLLLIYCFCLAAFLGLIYSLFEFILFFPWNMM